MQEVERPSPSWVRRAMAARAGRLIRRHYSWPMRPVGLFVLQGRKPCLIQAGQIVSDRQTVNNSNRT
jgi:hypothetical protein